MRKKMFVRALLISSMIFLTSVPAVKADTRSVSVSGSCIRSVIPDRGAVVLTAESKDPSSKRAQVAATKLYESVRAKVLALRLPEAEISTAEYTSEEMKEWEKNKLVSRGFRTRISLRVETSDHSRLGEVLEIGNREGLIEMTGLSLFVSTRKLLEEKMFCLKEAAEQARVKADALAKALGAKVGEVMSIQENAPVSGSEPPRPMMMKSMMADASLDRAAPTIEPGKTELNTTVHVVFELK